MAFKNINMIIATFVVSYLLPLQVYAGNLNYWRPQQDLFVISTKNIARLVGLPTPAKALYKVILTDEFKLRSIEKTDYMPKPRQLFFYTYMNQESVFKINKNAN